MADNQHPLLTVSLKVLEDWAMMLVDPASGRTEIFEADEPLFRSQIEMHGAFEGKLTIVAQPNFLRSLAANLLGSSDASSLTQEDMSDAFREMGNVLAGNFITEAYGADVAFDMINPKVEELDPQGLAALSNRPQTYYFLADDEPVCVSYEIGAKT